MQVGNVAANALIIEGSPSVTGIRTNAGSTLRLQGGGFTGLTISNGNVGIGTVNPTTMLDISGGQDGGSTLSTISLRGGATSNYTGIDFFTNANSFVGSFLYGNSAVPIAAWRDAFVAYYGNRAMIFAGSGANERMRITGAGNVGIGTTGPTSALDISGGDPTVIVRNSGTSVIRIAGNSLDPGIGLRVYHNSNDQGLYASNTLPMLFQTNATERMRITGGGKVGIMCNSPQQFLDVGAAQGGYSGTFWGFVSGGSLGNAAPAAYSIQALSNVLATGFYTYSDQRIKTNIIDLSDDQCLQQIRAIEPKRYEYIDKVERGSNPVYGFIAQQIRDVLPYAVTLQPGVVPDIQDMADFSNNIVTLRTKTFSFNDVSGNVRIITSDPAKPLQSYPVSFISSNQLRIDCSFTDVSDVFVYGREIPDYHQLDKNAIFTINVAATQELDRQLQAAKGKIQQLEDTLSNVLTRLSALEQPA